MKNSNDLIHYSGFTDPELESQLLAEHEQLKKLAEDKGYEYARKKQPLLKGDSLGVYVGLIESRYREMVARIHGRLQPKNTECEMHALQVTTDEKVKVLVKDKAKAEEVLFNYETDLLRNKKISIEDLAKTNSSKLIEKSIWAILIVGVAETFFTATGLQGIGHNFLVCLAIAAGISIVLYFTAKYIGQHLKEFKNGGTKTVITVAACAVSLGVFIGLAILRSKYLLAEDEVSISPFFLVLINILFFGYIVWTYYLNSQKPEEKKQEEDLLQYKKQWEEFKAQIAEIDNNIKAIKEDLAKRLNLLSHKPGYVKYLCERIEHLKGEAIECFISANLSSRADGIPDCITAYANNKQNV